MRSTASRNPHYSVIAPSVSFFSSLHGCATATTAVGPYRIHLQYGSCDGKAGGEEEEGGGGQTTFSSTSRTPSATPQETRSSTGTATANTTSAGGGKGFGWFSSLNVSKTPPPPSGQNTPPAERTQTNDVEGKKEQGQTLSSRGNASSRSPRVARLSPASVVIVEPAMTINGVPLKQESISIQTVLSRCLGSFSRYGSI